MSDFTYKIPDEERFFLAVVMYLKKAGYKDAVSLLKGSKCSIIDGGSFSGKRWDAHWTTVSFEIPMNRYELVMKHVTNEIEEAIRLTCDEVMPPKNGLDVMKILFRLSLEKDLQKKDLMADLEEITNELPPELRSEIIPDDVKEKAKHMSEVYVYLYCVENALRSFIEKISLENYSDDYLKYLKLNSEMRKKIEYRKKSKEKLQWLSIRGDSDIFYLDFEDLGTIIKNNWEIFEKYFESQEWIVTNINEIAECRNPVAHHSYLQEHERDIIRIDFIKIMKQISSAFG